MQPIDERLADAYSAHRRTLLAVAYRMLGSFTDAEDVVQDAFLRFRRALESGERPESDRAYLMTITSRLAIDELRSARVRREEYVGPWLPEPAVEGLTELADDIALADSLSTAFLVLLERLGPEQRAVLLLHDVFALTFPEVARIVGKSEEACRQIGARARRHVSEGRPRFTAQTREAEALADRFWAAAREGDLEGLVGLLAEQAEFVGDGGDSGRGLTRPVSGAEAVAHVVLAIFRLIRELGGTTESVRVGSQPAVLVLDDRGDLAAVWSLVIETDRIVAVHGMVNPEKLGHLGVPLTSLDGRATWHSRPR
ncbi:RNA polymerase sigma factor SigJ [Ornithinimicrobium cavernae]|uniref:RNA polymerase sigma factor SigJ n=1 Tax=Ornithinimicrobium cavernae TaxID=2666047 RepID=UPI000D69C505|nr:RNA polymerase sigma factor SigJ [Ornithinimicrobium cavernae]